MPLNELTLLEKVKELGFNAYEAKVYIALLKHHPATGYEISKESGVPQARAYDTLKSLQTANIVVSNGEKKPTTYTPISPDDLLNRRERSFLDCISYLRETLPAVSPDKSSEPVTVVQGRDPIIQQALNMIRHAKRSILMELWKEEGDLLKEALCKAHARGVMLKIVGYEDCELPGIEVFAHGPLHDLEQGAGQHWLALAVDDCEGMVGHFSPYQTPQAIESRNPCIVALIRQLVIHDICMLQVQKDLAAELNIRYGDNMHHFMQQLFTAEPLACP